MKAFLQADTWTMPWSPGERPRAISLPKWTSWFHVHSGIANAIATNATQATANDTPGIATDANDTHATASENAKHKNAGKTVRVNQATPKRTVLKEELAKIIEKYSDVLSNMSTSDIKEAIRSQQATNATNQAIDENPNATDKAK